MDIPISPPPLKRRRLSPPPEDSPAAKLSKSGTAASKSLRIVSWNINGISPFLQKDITSFFASPTKTKDTATNTTPRASLRDVLRRHNWPHLLLLQEVKIAPTDTSTIRAVSRAVAAPPTSPSEPDYKAFFTLPTDLHNARGFGRKVYGVTTLIRSDFATSTKARHRTVDWDQEGRFSIIETEEINGWPAFSIWNIYAVNGTENAYKDSRTGEVIGTRHDRKLQVHELLLDEANRLEKEGFGVVLAGDLNIARDQRDGFPNLRTRPEQHVRNRADFNHKFFESADGFMGIDTFRHLHGDERRYTYFPHGGRFGYSADRVDLIICSRGLGGQLIEAGMEDTAVGRGTSDHVPLFAGFDFDEDAEKNGASRREGSGEGSPGKMKSRVLA